MSFKEFSSAQRAPDKSHAASSKTKAAPASGADAQPDRKPAEGKPAPK